MHRVTTELSADATGTPETAVTSGYITAEGSISIPLILLKALRRIIPAFILSSISLVREDRLVQEVMSPFFGYTLFGQWLIVINSIRSGNALLHLRVVEGAEFGSWTWLASNIPTNDGPKVLRMIELLLGSM